MSTQVLVTLPDDTYWRAEQLARMAGRDIADVLAEMIGLSLQPPGAPNAGARPVADLPDAEVLTLADSHMDPAQDRRLSDLLEQQQAGRLPEEDCRALLALLQVYQDGLLRKAQALNEAVRRGLRPPLTSTDPKPTAFVGLTRHGHC
jgi:hypothetical protein